MTAGRTILQRFGAEMNITAFSAIPEYFLIALEYFVLHYILKQFPVSVFMSFFSRAIALKAAATFLNPSSSATLANAG